MSSRSHPNKGSRSLSLGKKEERLRACLLGQWLAAWRGASRQCSCPVMCRVAEGQATTSAASESKEGKLIEFQTAHLAEKRRQREEPTTLSRDS